MLKSNFYDKYLKYKTKYHQLKQMIGAGAGAVAGAGAGAQEYDIGDHYDSYDLVEQSRDIERMYDLEWKNIGKKFSISESTDISLVEDKKTLQHRLLEYSIPFSECSKLSDILDKYLNALGIKDIVIARYAYIVCIDNKYFLPDVLFFSDTISIKSDVYKHIKDNSGDMLKVKIVLFDLAIEYQYKYTTVISSPEEYLNKSSDSSLTIHLDYMQYIAILRIFYMNNHKVFYDLQNTKLLNDYRFYAFLILFNINLINIARGKIIDEQIIIKLMKIRAPYIVFAILVFNMDLTTTGEPVSTTPTYKQKILEELVKLLNVKINKEILNLDLGSKDSVMQKRNIKEQKLKYYVENFNKHKIHNTSMNNYELFIVDADIHDGNELTLNFRLVK